MKKLIFTVVGALFLFVSCQSDLLESDDAFLNEASKSENANRVTKDMRIRSYEGVIEWLSGEGDCNDLQFTQTGGGIASHIGQYTLVNTACANPDYSFAGPMTGVITAANGDEIYTLSLGFECDDPEAIPGVPCPGVNTTFTYQITGGSGRFEGASGYIYIYGEFVFAGPFKATGTAIIKY